MKCEGDKMTDLRDNIGWIIGSIGGVGALILGYLQQYEFLGAILATTIGAGVAYFVQTRTQKRTWKREYSVRIVEEVYGPLFKEMKLLVNALEKKWYRRLNFSKWMQLQGEYYYHMVDEKFATELDNFLERLETYDGSINKLDNIILPNIAYEETKRVFGIDPIDNARLDIKGLTGRGQLSVTPNIIECLKTQTYPIDQVKKDYPNISGLECLINIKRKKGEPAHTHEVAKFDEFWKSSLERMLSEKTYSYIIEENKNLLEEAKEIQKKLITRIKEPWNI